MSIDMRINIGRYFNALDGVSNAHRQVLSSPTDMCPTLDRPKIVRDFLRDKEMEYLTRLERANSERDYKEAHICFSRLSYIQRLLEEQELTSRNSRDGHVKDWFRMGRVPNGRTTIVRGARIDGTRAIVIQRARPLVREAAPDRTRVLLEYLGGKEAELESQLETYTSTRDHKKAYSCFASLWTVRRLMKELQPTPEVTGSVDADGTRTFVISSIFLARLYSYLVSRGGIQDEAQCFATGVYDKKRRIAYPSFLLTTRMSVRNPVRCRSDDRATLDTFAMADDFGHRMLLVAHLHPGEMIYPSGQDLMTHDAYERGGYMMLGAIFVRSGMVRFYSNNMPFKVEVYGSGAKRVEYDLWRLTRFDTSAGQIEKGAV